MIFGHTKELKRCVICLWDPPYPHLNKFRLNIASLALFFFFRYLQVRDFIFKKTFASEASLSLIEKLLLNCPVKKVITSFYNVLYQTSVILAVSDAALTWQTELGVAIDKEKWDVICIQTKRISVCNRARLLQFKIIHRLQISPSKRHKMNPQTSPGCLKCKSALGTYTHCVWYCPKIQLYWQDILKDMSAIFGTAMTCDPVSLLLGYRD